MYRFDFLNIPSYYGVISRIFRSKKIIVIVGGSPEMNQLANYEIDAMTVINSTDFQHHSINSQVKTNFGNATIIFNSKIIQKVYQSLEIAHIKSFVQYFNLQPLSEERAIKFNERKYDICYVASDFGRTIKNADLAWKIFRSFPEYSCVAIGKNKEIMEGIATLTISDLIDQHSILALLSETKLLVIPSYFDSSPGVLSEAVICGCNVLVSKNVGWSELLTEQSVVQNYFDEQEWIAKTRSLLKDKMEYPAMQNMIRNSEAGIINTLMQEIDFN